MKIQSVYTGLHLWLAAAALAAMPAWADGQLDQTFGDHGVVKIAFPNAPHGGVLLHRIAVVNGVIEAVGYYENCNFPDLAFVRLSLAGVVIGSPLSYRQQAVQCPSDLVIDSATGDFYVTGGNAVAWFNASGTLIATYTVIAAPPNDARCDAGKSLIDNQGRFVAACAIWGPNGEQKAALLRLSPGNGTLGGGLMTIFPWQISTGGWPPNPTVITQDTSSGGYYVGVTYRDCRKRDIYHPISCYNTQSWAMRLDANTGALDGGVGVLNGPYEVLAIALDDSGDVLIAGSNRNGANGEIVRFDSVGPDTTFGSNGIVDLGDGVNGLINSIVDIRTDHSGQVYALASLSQLYRLKPDGSYDATFSSSSDVQTLNGISSGWMSVEFADSSQSSAYLVGGAHGCSNCPATSAIIAKVILVGPGTTTTTLSSSATTISAGQTVTLTANVVGTNPIGTVTFKDGATTLSAASLSSGSVIYSSSSLATGSHSITASYSGDSNNSPSVSTAVIETVNAALTATTTALTSSATTVESGQVVKLAATVTGTNPTGTVSFKDGSATLGSPVTVSAGTASYSIATLAVGSHSITASYSGDSKNAPSSSTATTVMVRAVSTASSGYGGGGSFTWADLCVGFLLTLWRLRRISRIRGVALAA